MRPVDNVEENRPPDTGFLFRGPGWQSNILPVLFVSLIVLSAIVGSFVEDSWLVTFVSGTAILIVVLATNEVLKRTLRK